MGHESALRGGRIRDWNNGVQSRKREVDEKMGDSQANSWRFGGDLGGEWWCIVKAVRQNERVNIAYR
jgi:hypothetical protein